ncbi:cytochrome c-type biogenesis protein CcmH [Zoogloea oleivorans]|uniref:Cytochrome c-type biogenesis protein n=1 Tax=Zoogloea oleivorans TaxID=1552750 RepID=A0A6C2D3C7_9RHOO|nr:cytochrome c-type biogenesis protein [Zoogloea oleivorans]MBT9499402.1 cytochrome c-type biogenesis protein CcmH [Zoogloea sp.]NTV97485.1 cytochrome c-type biogenesis protein CcmH [Thiobacillus sp.]TYC60082.1 cytochrome c-type biogenesis protein CcmH [Zoogloea oleivorans]
MKQRLITAAAALLLALPLAHAGEATPMAEDPVVEARMVAISEELRCLVCQNESLAASHAELAEDLRREVRTLVREGKTDPEIKEYLVSRYGDFVLYRPPVKPTTWFLWFGPFVILGGAVIGLIAYLRRRAGKVVAPALSATDKAAAKALLTGQDSPNSPKDQA